MRAGEMTKRSGLVRILRSGEDGATSLEYALLIAFVAMVCVVAVTSLGQALKGPFQSANSGLS
jgi:Flp pilus assembly pilin Flp